MKNSWKALITGGAGFIGSHIADLLILKGLNVICLDDLSNGLEKNIPQKAKFIKGNILNTALLKNILKEEKIDFILHNAAIVSIRNSLNNFYHDCETNIMGTLSLLEACKINPPKRFIFASSMGIYGDSSAKKPLKEDDKIAPLSPYGISKITCEKYLKLLCPRIGMDYVILRYFNTYGERQQLSPYVGVITIFANLLRANKQPVIYGDGRQCRDFISVLDIARANLAALSTGNINEVYNVGTGIATSVNQIFSLVSQVFEKTIKPKYLPTDSAELKFAVADTAKAACRLNFVSREVLNADVLRSLFNKNSTEK